MKRYGGTLKTAELYVGLVWEAVELLIRQQDISDASLGETTDYSLISVDNAVSIAFNDNLSIPQQTGNFQSVLTIAGKRYATSVMPQSITIDSERDRTPHCRILKSFFSRHGLLSISFTETTIRYIVDMAKFTAGGSR